MNTVRESVINMAESGELPGFGGQTVTLPSSFALESPQAAIHQKSGRGSKPRPEEPPKQKIQAYRLIVDTDPHAKEGIETYLDYLIGSGWSIEPANIIGADEGQDQSDQDVQNLRTLFAMSPTWDNTYESWVKHALIDGQSYMQLVVQEDVFRPNLLPPDRVKRQVDEYDNLVEYIYETPGGDEKKLPPHAVAELWFHKHPAELYGRSHVEPVEEQIEMLRDMELDLARFIATKAYPPIIWKLGTDERPRSQTEIQRWLDTVEEIQPDSMLAVSHDVEHDVVGVTSTSSNAGAMKLEGVFEHLMRRIYTGMGLPAFLGNIPTDAATNDSVTMMPKFDRRIQRYRNRIRTAVRYQIFTSLLAGDKDPAELKILPPEWKFGQHSSEENRLDAEMVISLFNSALITREAAVVLLGMDPETQMPQEGGELEEQVSLINELAGKGDNIQNPEGGSPTGNGAGGETSSTSVKTRRKPSSVDSDSRPKRDVTS